MAAEEGTVDAQPGYFCSVCGEWHDEMPMNIAFIGPEPSLIASAEENGISIERSSEWYVIGDMGFIRAILNVPVVDAPTDEAERFCWGVWVIVRGQDFQRIIVDTWGAGMPEEEPMPVGYLGNEVPGYPNTLFMEVDVDARSATQRASVFLKDGTHPLAIEQRHGITMTRVQEINEQLYHRMTGSSGVG
jgi:hypothetical protein